MLGVANVGTRICGWSHYPRHCSHALQPRSAPALECAEAPSAHLLPALLASGLKLSSVIFFEKVSFILPA